MKKRKHVERKRTTLFSFPQKICLFVLVITIGIISWTVYEKIQAKVSATIQVTNDSLDLTDNEQALADQIDQLLQKNKYVGSVYIRKNDRVILEKGYGYANEEAQQPNTPSLYYQIGSIQKAMTALLILKQVNSGKLSLDTKLAEFYPQINGSKKITIKDLLYMRSGLKRTASPTVPMNDQEVIQFALDHLEYTNDQTYKYEPLNFTLLTGILIKLTHQPYEKLIYDELITPLQLKQTSFYDQVKNTSEHAVSYQMSPDDDYHQALTESETDIRNELGTGNISMSVYDLNEFFTKVLKGKLIPKDLLFSLWGENSSGRPYNGGVYSAKDTIFAQGNINRFHAVLAMTKDTSDAVVMESNIQADKKYKTTATELRDQICKLMGNNE
ncbi:MULTISPECIES: serine hydrolase domain-containing protein [unclassified Enterococcus]|uniref:serine hydrolase domain-containing protein n=1 Tax=unclassified Enterococcus TaxID=2608891 RepID=UPI001A9C0E05|nr:serine hydrolase domain-containing protein [Enterococcus sp. DIV1271a]MBO1300387.1 beta-lactamase family protein [Enterococcus sp. DIV1271a]